jgi:hypothetical protein
MRLSLAQEDQPRRSPLLVDPDDEVAFGDVVARDAQFLRRVELP